jgi:hypothetical protein
VGEVMADSIDLSDIIYRFYKADLEFPDFVSFISGIELDHVCVDSIKIKQDAEAYLAEAGVGSSWPYNGADYLIASRFLDAYDYLAQNDFQVVPNQQLFRDFSDDGKQIILDFISSMISVSIGNYFDDMDLSELCHVPRLLTVLNSSFSFDILIPSNYGRHEDKSLADLALESFYGPLFLRSDNPSEAILAYYFETVVVLRDAIIIDSLLFQYNHTPAIKKLNECTLIFDELISEPISSLPIIGQIVAGLSEIFAGCPFAYLGMVASPSDNVPYFFPYANQGGLFAYAGAQIAAGNRMGDSGGNIAVPDVDELSGTINTEVPDYDKPDSVFYEQVPAASWSGILDTEAAINYSYQDVH